VAEPTDPEWDVKMHAWRIDPAQYARHEARRGRRHAFERLDPARTALVVVDMIPFFVDENPYCRGIIPNIAVLADALRSAGGVVAWVLPARSAEVSAVAEEFFGPATAARYNSSAGTGPLAGRLWPGFEVHAGDLLVEKSAASAFFPGRSPLPALLHGRGVDTVVVTGTVTNVCCESSARDASTLGYRVIMVADANAGQSDESHNATLHTVYRTFGDVRPTHEVLDLIAAGRP
jgi:nicotinamidase-related amidase